MGMLENLGFRGGNRGQAPAPGGAPQGQNGGTGGGIQNMGNQNDPNGQNGQPAPQPQPAQQPAPSTDPLAVFGKMYDNTGEQEAPPGFTLDDKQLSTVASAQDFTQGIDPAMMEAAMTGDAKSMLAIMKQVGQNAYKASLAHGSKLTDSFVTAREAHSSKGLGGKVRNELTQHALSTTPNFQNPVVKKQLVMHAEALQRQHPDASPAEIAKMAKDYITELASAINPQKDSQPANAAGPTDWDGFFDEPEMNSR